MSVPLFPHTEGATYRGILPLQSAGATETSSWCTMKVAGYCRAKLPLQSAHSRLGGQEQRLEAKAALRVRHCSTHIELREPETNGQF